MVTAKINQLYLLLAALILVASGCTGVNTFGTAARPGDTVALSLGWQQELTRQDIKVVITDQDGSEFTYLPGNSAIRALYNSYPDPISNLIVGAETGQPMIGGSFAGIANSLILSTATNGDKDFAQTFLVLDLPTITDGIVPGSASINITDPLDNPIPSNSSAIPQIFPVSIEILTGTGASNTFSTQEGVSILPGYLTAMERSQHYTISLDSVTVPHAIQLDFEHNPDLDNSGVGRAYVVNPRSDLKTVNWTDDGVNLRVIIMPARDQTLANMKDFKFYVAGGITGLALSTVVAQPVQGFDNNGAVTPDPVTVSIIP